MASIQVLSTTSSSIVCRVIDVDTSVYTDVEWLIMNDAGDLQSYGAFIITSSVHDFTLDGLTSNSSYIVVCKLYYKGGWDSIQSDRIYLSDTPSTSRPSQFYWSNVKTRGGLYNLTAVEWNDLCANINAVRSYKGLSIYNFTTAYKGDTFYAAMYNQAVESISNIAGVSVYLSYVSPDQTVTADHLNLLVSAINSVA